VGVVDADAPPRSEKLNPAAPTAFTVEALVLRFCFEACLTGMVASSVRLVNRLASVRSAKPPRKGYVRDKTRKNLIEFHSSS
jgi:hypothetical protein